jgi:hypothetical protein
VDCEEGQQGKCCCGGVEGACCQEGEYCCDGVCQAEECEGCEGPCEGDEDCSSGCVCVGGECVAEGFCCYKDIFGTYSFSVGQVSGTLTDGLWFGGPEFLALFCTGDVPGCTSGLGPGLFLEFYDGTDNWRGYESGNAQTYPCGSQSPLAGTYTLINCSTSATLSLVIT